MRQVRLFDIAISQDLEKIEDPLKLLDSIANSDCTRCRRAEFRHANEGQKITIYRGNPMASLWVVGKSPGMNDGLEGVPYSFGSGDLLQKWLRFLCDNPEENTFMTNPVFCAAEDDANPTQTEMRACSFYFDMLVDKLKPKVFLCLGMVGYQAVAKGHIQERLSDIAGMESPYPTRFDIPAWVVYHPAFFFKGTNIADEAKMKNTKTLQAMKKSIYGI